ncbi:hypothetical protein INT45_012095, partial [Circinella minor]
SASASVSAFADADADSPIIRSDPIRYTSVFFFLVVLYTNKEYPAPFFELEKGLFLLYHLVSGIAGEDIEKYLLQSTFHTFYKKFWMDDENYKRRINGHDSRINYIDTDLDRSWLYLYKFKKNGLCTQFAADVNDMILFISKSEFCSDSSDGSMFLNMKLYNKININDTLAVDGGYTTLFITQFTELANEKGYDFNNDNFIYPICKNINENLTITEEHFNNIFESFRSKIENQFSEIGNKFYRFNNNKSVVKMDNIEFYNLQFRVACLLKNISKFVKLFNIPILLHHKLWHSCDFDFPIEKKLIDIVVSNNKQNKDKFDRMMQLQNNLLNMTISDNTMAVDDTDSGNSENNESDNDVPNFNEHM